MLSYKRTYSSLICVFFISYSIQLSIIQETIYGEIFLHNIKPDSTELFAYVEDSVTCPKCFHITTQQIDFLDDNEFFAGKVVWNNFINQTGWGHLNVQAYNEITDNEKAYVSGFLEGLITHNQISDFYKNIEGVYFNPNHPEWKTLALNQLNATVNWITTSFLDNNKKSKKLDFPFLQWMHTFMLQIWGITDGYNLAKQTWQLDDLPNLNAEHMLMLSLNGDLDFIRNLFECAPNEQSNSNCLSKSSQFNLLTEDNVYVGHTTWASYSEMNRIIKYYDIPYQNSTVAKLAFSSYPGSITSNDDFILTSNKLAILETSLATNKNFLNRQWFLKNKKKFTEGSFFPDTFNVLRASYLANTSKDWTVYMQDHKNSFYDISSAQWMVVDYKNCCDSKSFFYVLEIIPGQTIVKDMTPKLIENLYWGSENKPYFPSTITMLENITQVPTSPWYGNSRNITFSTLYSPVVNVEVMKHFMQFTVPDASLQDFSVSPRFDLTSLNEPRGGIDSKVVDNTLIDNLRFWAKSGPSIVNGTTFQWIENNTDVFDPKLWPHFGQPNVWDFEWQLSDQYGFTPHNFIVVPVTFQK